MCGWPKTALWNLNAAARWWTVKLRFNLHWSWKGEQRFVRSQDKDSCFTSGKDGFQIQGANEWKIKTHNKHCFHIGNARWLNCLISMTMIRMIYVFYRKQISSQLNTLRLRTHFWWSTNQATIIKTLTSFGRMVFIPWIEGQLCTEVVLATQHLTKRFYLVVFFKFRTHLYLEWVVQQISYTELLLFDVSLFIHCVWERMMWDVRHRLILIASAFQLYSLHIHGQTYY